MDDNDDDDHRDWFTHLIHGVGHMINYSRKSNGKPGIEESDYYKNKSPGKAQKGPWSKEVDDERAGYHLMKFNKEMEKIMDRGPP